MEPAFVLAHSLLLGPSTWAPVAASLRGTGAVTVVPSLVDVTDADDPPFWPSVAAAVDDAISDLPQDQPIVLVAHSNASPASAAPLATSDSHFFFAARNRTDTEFRIYQSRMVPAGAFAARVDITAQTGARFTSPSIKISAVKVAGEMHLLVLSGQTLYHTVRLSNGTWPAFTTVSTSGYTDLRDLSAASVGGQLQVTIRSGSGIIHARRLSLYNWTQFSALSTPANLTYMASAGLPNGELHVFVDTWTSGSDKLFGTIRRTDGTWTNWDDLTDNVRPPSANFIVFGMSATAVGNDVHLVVNHWGSPYHAVRYGNTGQWTQLYDIFRAIDRPGQVEILASGGYPGNGEYMFAAKVYGPPRGDDLIHALRYADGSWWGAFNSTPAPTEGVNSVKAIAVAGE